MAFPARIRYGTASAIERRGKCKEEEEEGEERGKKRTSSTSSIACDACLAQQLLASY